MSQRIRANAAPQRGRRFAYIWIGALSLLAILMISPKRFLLPPDVYEKRWFILAGIVVVAELARRSLVTYTWIVALAQLVFWLVYFEQIAPLYILATLGVTALLFVVAAADIGYARPSAEGIGQPFDAQASSSGIASKVSVQKSNGQSNK